jgi:transposase
MNAQSSGKGKEKEKPKGNRSQGQPKKPDLTEKLGKDGKLTQQECQRRQDNNLCLFCGQAGHRVRECPRSTVKRLIVYLMYFIELNRCELLDDVESTMCRCLRCVRRQASLCRASASADARIVGSVMKAMQGIVVSRVRIGSVMWRHYSGIWEVV